MTRDELLTAMRPPRLPDAAPVLSAADVAFAALLGIGAAVLVGLVLIGMARRRRGGRAGPRQAALAALSEAEAIAPAERAVAVAALLRRYVAATADEAAARLSGEDWLVALDRHFRTGFFTGGAGRCLGDDLYVSAEPPDAVLVPEIRRLILARRR